MAKVRRIQEELEARRCLLAVAASGRPLAEWARENGIDGRSLNAWRVNLGRREANAAKPRPAKAPVRHARSGLVEHNDRRILRKRFGYHYALSLTVG